MVLLNSFYLAVSLLLSSMNVEKEIIMDAVGIDEARGGNLIVMVFGPEGFPRDHASALSIQTHVVAGPNMRFRFNVQTDFFAVKVLHDEDENNKVTKNWAGIYPKEGLGFSNAQKVTLFGPPKYRKSRVQTLAVNKPLIIEIRYPKSKRKARR